ncbi:Crp/Fnr family transcriptional regulator [Pararhodospirillum oryzae]|uniref:Cyclic nucleotide-binding protein n=1 Tax=Pararhodospirillum oryzae TaxID=478448 RepID=A0A512HC21_9PROT|nr:cyclic nucleotide-binding domain-containing protein [Pararhodospirillum oryzae]GEO82989.1 cyclic nucleotide-binding protein [Pararhodospirillum oryzae]
MAGSSPFTRQSFPDGTVLFREGDAADAAYMVESGVVEMVVRCVDGSERIIGTVGPGEMFGEMGLIDDRPRMATARVAMEAMLVRIPAAAFKAQLKTVNPIMTRVLVQLAKRLRALSHELTLTPRGD